MNLSLSLPSRSEYIDHQGNIKSALREIPCNMLHGTRSTTLIRMLDSDVPEDFQECLLAKAVAESVGITPESGGFKTLTENESDLVHEGKAVSTVDIDNGDVAHDYATSSRYFPNLDASFPVIFGIARSDSMVIKKIEVGIPAFSNRVIVDRAVENKINGKNIKALLVPEGKSLEVKGKDTTSVCRSH